MKITVSGKHVDIGDSLKTYVESHLADMIAKFFDHPLEAHAVLGKNGHLFRCDLSVHVIRGLIIRCHGEADEGYKCIDQAIHKLHMQMSKYKNKLKNHHRDKEALMEYLSVQKSVIDISHTEEREDAHPAIIAEIEMDIPTLSVGEAVMRMDLGDSVAVMFKNSQHGEFNVVYRRADGNVGWIDPKKVRVVS